MLASLLVVLMAGAVLSQVKVDPNLPRYTKGPSLTGNLSAVGSDTMNNLMTYWGEGFQKLYPGVNIQVEGKGSSTAPPALISGTAQLGPMSRKMKREEVNAFEKRFGYPPTRVIVAIDTLAVYVNKDNPLGCLSLSELDAIFSSTRKLGWPEEITTWDQLGLGGKFDGQRISLYGRNSVSGTYGFFKEKALNGGDFKNTVKEQPGSASVVQGVSQDLFGIGYSGIGYKTSGVKVLAIAKKKGGKCYLPTVENALSGRYPLARPLQIYVNKNPNRDWDPLIKEFLRYALSYEGQEMVIKAGYFPLPAKEVKKQLEALGLK